MRHTKASRFIRQLLAAALYKDPYPVKWLREDMEKQGCPFHKVEAVARSLGVESVEYRGRTCWRLPDKVLPFVPRDCYGYVFHRYHDRQGRVA
jgi:hypothetical protein